MMRRNRYFFLFNFSLSQNSTFLITKNSVFFFSFLGAITNLLDGLTDKDDQVRTSIETSLRCIAEKHTNSALKYLCDYKQKHEKLGEIQTSVILRVIESITITETKTTNLENETIEKVIDLAVAELIKVQDHCPILQKPSLEILVSIGREYCSLVMEQLMKHLPQGQIAHFMILHCIGTLAIANVDGIIDFIKPCCSIILPTLGMIKQDHVKQSYAYAIGHFAEAISEFIARSETSNSTDPFEQPPTENNFSTEISIAYEVLLHQWLPNREPKVCIDILYALTQMFPLLNDEKIDEEIVKRIPFLLNLYRRSIDRIAITQFLAAVLHTNNGKLHKKLLDNTSDQLISSLFDLICVTPDYDKPQTVKGHFEVLRCFDLLSESYHNKILEMLLVQLKSNNDRERIKALLVLTHLTNVKCSHRFVEKRGVDFIKILKFMITNEKLIKLKVILLKTIIAFAEKGFIKNDEEFIIFIVRHCCHYNKIQHDNGTTDEHESFVDSCNKTLFILSTTVGTIDNMLKHELLKYYLNLTYTDAVTTIVKCLSSLFGKSPELMSYHDENLSEINSMEESNMSSSSISSVNVVPSPESVFVRSLVLMGNFDESQRIIHILSFLKNYCVNLNKHLMTLWNDKIPELTENVNKGEKEKFYENLYKFLVATIKDIDDSKFPEGIINKMSDQLNLYPATQHQQQQQSITADHKIPSLNQERGLLLKLLGVSLGYVTDSQTLDAKIDLILNTAKLEKLEKNVPNSGFEYRLTDASKSLGFIAKVHLDVLLKKLEVLIQDEGTKKSTGNFFSGLNFIKDAQKDIDIYKIKVLVIEAYGYIVINAPKHQLFENIDEKMIDFLMKQLQETKDFILKKMILKTFLKIAEEIYKLDEFNHEFKTREDVIKLILKIPIDTTNHENNISLFPTIIKLVTLLVKIDKQTDQICDQDSAVIEHLNICCCNFFLAAQQLKSKFNSPEEDAKNSFLANYLNKSLPELNNFVRVLLERNPSPACLDDVHCILENWLKDKNSEVRICAGHVLNNSLDVSRT